MFSILFPKKIKSLSIIIKKESSMNLILTCRLRFHDLYEQAISFNKSDIFMARFILNFN